MIYTYIYIYIKKHLRNDILKRWSPLFFFKEHALDQTWRFLLELVGLFERLDAEEAEAEAETGCNHGEWWVILDLMDG